MVRLSCTAASRCCPRFGNNDHVTAEITKHQMCTSHGTCLILDYCGQHTCMSVTRKDLAAAAPGLPWSAIVIMSYEVMLWLCYGCVMVMSWLLLWLVQQPVQRLCYGCCANQKRRNISAVLTAPHIFFQPLSPCLAYHGFSEWCAQWDTTRQLALWSGSAIYLLCVCFHLQCEDTNSYLGAWLGNLSKAYSVEFNIYI